VPADLFRRGLFVDVETTGLDAGKDTVIELAMVPFGYRADGEIVWVSFGLQYWL
jgi:DNA polymerase-3 subunit epsilon